MASLFDTLLDLPTRAIRRLQGRVPDYREFLFEDLKRGLGDRTPGSILEIGPRDGVDTRRLLSLGPQRMALVDLPDKEQRVREWMAQIDFPGLELTVGNLMYDEVCSSLGKFDVVWCTGVLYHNPEQLRMVRRLYDLVSPGGFLVIESATARRKALRNENCVEIWHDVDKQIHRRHHVSKNVTHLPSRSAIASWLDMVGFEDILHSKCHRLVTRGLAADRAAYVARRPLKDRETGYYAFIGLNYEIGRAR